MLAKIKKWVEPPIFDGDEEKTTLADILNRMGLILLIVYALITVFYIPLFIEQKLEAYIMVAALTALFFLARRYLFMGKLELSALIQTIPAWLLFYIVAFFGGGINSPLLPVILTSTIVISFIFQQRFRLIFLLLGILLAFGLVLSKNNTAPSIQLFIFSPIASWIMFSLALLFIQFFITIVVNNMKRSLQKVKQQSDARLLAEQALKFSEDRFQMFMRFFPGLAYIKTFDGRVLFANQGFNTYLGMDPIDMIGKTNEMLFGDEFGRKIQEDDRKVITSNTSHKIDEEFAGKYWSTYKFPIDRPGQDPLLGGVTLDITRQKIAEKKLRESEYFFRESQKAAHIGSYKANLINETWESSEILDEIFGIKPSEPHTLNLWMDMIHPDDRDNVEICFQNEAEDKNLTFNLEYRIIRKLDGDIRWVFESGQIEKDVNERPISRTGIVQDITERKQAIDALHESEVRFGNLLQSVSSVAVQGFTSDGIIKYWNKASEVLYGYSAEEAIGRNFFDLVVPPESFDELSLCIKNMIKTGQTAPAMEHILMTKDGTRIPVLTSHAVAQVSGQQFELYCIDMDLTEKKKAEKELAQTQALIKAIVDHTPNMVWTVDPVNFSLLTWNPTFENYFMKHRGIKIKSGMRPEDLYPRGSGYIELWHSLYQNALKEGLFITEYKVQSTPDILQLTINSLTEGNHTFGISVFGEIITERKRAEERIEQSERKYRELFQENKDAICIYFQSREKSISKYVEVNNTAPKMFGFTPEEMLEMTPLDLEPTVTDEQLTHRQMELEVNGIVNYETVYRNKAGMRVHVEISGQSIQYDGKPAVMEIIRDITDRKQHDIELQAIATLSSALRTAPRRAEMLPVIVEQTVNMLDCDCATIEIIDPVTGEAVVEAAHGLWERLIGTRQKAGTGINAIIQSSRKPYITQNLEKDPRTFYHEWARYGIMGSVGMPLIAQDNLFGFMWVGRRSSISQNEIRLLSAIADIAANAIYRSTLHEQTQKDAAELANAYETTLEGWARALELREQETAGHSKRVVKYSVELAKAMGFGPQDLINIQRGARLHDIGKMGIPDKILLKKGPLSEKEWQVMRKHPIYAHNLLSQIPYLIPALDIPYYHHERWDGTGYPNGLKEYDIPIAARIFSVVDVWDALSSDRPYRKAWSEEEVLLYLKEQAGRQFDPEVVATFLKILENKKDSEINDLKTL
ncbi:PAS domain S-box protein [Leptolinea tardivitalis]|nr:PAS domain S-box protein [Leptolinea tardivitalis]GAP21641.1 protein containing PAS domain S-box [Leptolinea tardivitalis]